MRKLLTLLLAVTLTNSESVSRDLLLTYSKTFSLDSVKLNSNKSLLSTYGLNFKQNIYDFGEIKTLPLYRFQNIVTGYSKGKYCIPDMFEVSVFNKPVYYLPFLKNDIINVMKSNGNVYQTSASNLQGVMIWKHSKLDYITLGYVHKTTPTQYVLSICQLKGG